VQDEFEKLFPLITTVSEMFVPVRPGAAFSIAVSTDAHGSEVWPLLIDITCAAVFTPLVSVRKLCMAMPNDNIPVTVISRIGIAKLNSTSDWPLLLRIIELPPNIAIS